jgi:hypothetical protein
LLQRKNKLTTIISETHQLLVVNAGAQIQWVGPPLHIAIQELEVGVVLII